MKAHCDVIERLAHDLKEARSMRHMTVAQCADEIGISDQTLRDIENGTRRNVHDVTLGLILVWAGSRGHRQFAGFDLAL